MGLLVKVKAPELAKSKRKSNNLFDNDSEDETKNKSSSKKEKFSLIDGDDNGGSDADDYDAKKAFESKLNLNEKTANKVT